MEEILQFLTNYKTSKFKKGAIIFSEQQVCEYVGFIKSGSVKISSFFENGKEVIYNIIKKGGIFGANLIFSSSPFFRGDVISLDDSEIYLLNKAEIKILLRENDLFLESFLKIQSDFSKSLNLSIKLLTFNNASERFMYYLDINKGKLQYKSISELANRLFLTRESLSRTVHKLEKDHIISISKKEILKL